MKKIAFKTLGCRLNQSETDALASEFQKNGYEVKEFEEENAMESDAFIINTCTVTGQSDKKSRSYLHQAAKTKDKPLIVLTGCMVNNQKDRFAEDESITYLVENNFKSSIFSLVDAHFKGEMIPLDSLQEDPFGYQNTETSFHTRANLKIQDGCDNFCTFCIIPKVRGRAISRPYADIRKNMIELLAAGYKEIVLTGVNIGRYTHKGMNFTDVVANLLKIPGDFRIRISSIEPDGFGDEFLDLFKNPKLCPHLHLCLQSGSDDILIKMRRMYATSTFKDIASRLREIKSDFNFTTDIMVGFPGESSQDFQSSLDISKELNFSHIHTFKYSIRKGTRAERMSDQIPGKVKTERSRQIRLLADQMKMDYRSSFIGKTQRVLIERIENGVARGYGEHYVPVQISSADFKSTNSFVDVRIKKINKNKGEPVLIGELI